MVPHGMHDGHPDLVTFARRYPRDVQIIGTRAPVGRVIRAIGRCDAVVSSSLHGLVVADSFRIPSAWFGLKPTLWGGSFKFADYESVVTPGRSRRVILTAGSPLTAVLDATAPAESERVAISMTELEASLGQVETLPLAPFLALRARGKD